MSISGTCTWLILKPAFVTPDVALSILLRSVTGAMDISPLTVSLEDNYTAALLPLSEKNSLREVSDSID